MFGLYWLYLSAHCVGVALFLKVLKYVLPCCITGYYSCAANVLFYILVARYTFVYTKRKFLSERIQPENRAVLVTGCDSGFGNALVRRLDSKGYHVFASCFFPEGEGAKQLRESCSRRLHVLGLDVTSDKSVSSALQHVKDNLGTSELWAIVNNAGVQKGYTAELTDMQDYVDCMEVNAFGMVRVTKAFLPLLRQSKGRVINLTSIAGRMVSPNLTSYTMSKYAAVAFNDCLRQEMDVWGVKVISIEPELFNTPMFNGTKFAERLDVSMEKVDEDLRADYGEDYLKKFRLCAEYNLNMGSTKIYKVVDGLYDAVSMEHPNITYHPCRNIVMRVALSVYFMLPLMVQDLIMKILTIILSFPKPAGASSS